MKVLVTGGAGYVGSCICQALIKSGHTPVILDSLLSGREGFVADKIFYKSDISDKETIFNIFRDHPDIEFTIHCAERAMVDFSVFNPYEYYVSNVVKSIDMFKTLSEVNCHKIILCSSASIYDDVAGYMVSERSPIRPGSPFARSKYIMEMVLQDFCTAYDMRCITLRYFNPIGAAPDLSCGPEKSNSGNAVSRLIHSYNTDEPFVINGTDWETRDGTCIRDYIHVWDVAEAHVAAMEAFDKAICAYSAEIKSDSRYLAINIGTGIGSTVTEAVKAFENTTGEKINVIYVNRRPGDNCGSYADTNMAKRLIGWKAQLSMEEAMLDALRWEEEKGKR
jgi:UDP-glucose 4-epimerase